MDAAGRGAADQQRNVEALALHFVSDMHHLIQRRRDQAGQADDVGLVLARGVENFLRRRHHAQIDHLIAVALQHHADDVLADVVHVALHRRHHDAARRVPSPGSGLLGFHEGQQIGDRFFHHAGGFDHLRQKHLARAEQIADHVHARHQRAFDHIQWPRRLQRAPLRYPRR